MPPDLAGLGWLWWIVVIIVGDALGELVWALLQWLWRDLQQCWERSSPSPEEPTDAGS